ncbi:MAG: hypothetical protein HQ558_03320 [Candidatus Omnitrophica bacterium]|nr:hypothetical protein [Candidatus Omnitrophota bacterium]
MRNDYAMNTFGRMVVALIAILFLSAPVSAWAETADRQGIILENELIDPTFFTLERQEDGTDILQEESALYNLEHLKLIGHIKDAVNYIYSEHKEELDAIKIGSIVVAYGYPHHLEINFLSANERIKKKFIYEEPETELPIRSALVIFDFLEIEGKVDLNIVSFVQLYPNLHLESEVELEYTIEKGSWIVEATGYVTKKRLFVTAKTKVHLSTEVARKHIANKVAVEYQRELEKLGAKEITIRQKETPTI